MRGIKIVEQYQAKDNSVTLYLNGLAHITTSVQLNSQDNIVRVSGIAPKSNLETLHTIFNSKGVRILEARVLEPTTLEEIARGNIGQKVKDSAGEEVEVLSYGGHTLLVRGKECIYVVWPSTLKLAPPKEIIKERSVEMRLEELAGDQLRLSYLTEGLTLTPHYNIVLMGDKLVLTAEVEVDNKTGKSFEGIELEVIPGNVEAPYLPREAPRIRRAGIAGTAFLAVTAMAEGVESFEEGGQIGYAFGTKNLPEGHSKFSVFTTEPLEYQVVYRANLRHEKPDVVTNLKFKTPVTLTIGSVAVYAEKLKPFANDPTLVPPPVQKLIERYEGGGAIHGPVLKDGEVNIKLRTPDTLEMEVQQIGGTRIVNTGLGTASALLFALERDFLVGAKNSGPNDVTIEALLNLEETEQLLKSSMQQHSKSSGRMVRWDAPVTAGGEISFNYTVRDIQFEPASEHEVRRRLGR